MLASTSLSCLCNIKKEILQTPNCICSEPDPSDTQKNSINKYTEVMDALTI